MNSFDKFWNKAKDVADAAAQKTGEVVEVSKLKLQALKLNGSIQKAYEELGSVYYNSVKFGGNPQDQLHACVAEIDRLLKEQEDLENSMNQVGKNTVRYCTACGFENDGKSSFCSRCGTPLNSVVVDVHMSSNEE